MLLFRAPLGQCDRMQVSHGAPDRHAAPWHMERAHGRTAACPPGSSAVGNGQRGATTATKVVLEPVLDLREFTDFVMSETDVQ